MGKSLFTRLLSVVVLLLIGLGIYTTFRLQHIGAFRSFENHPDGNSMQVASYPGPEALQLDYQRGILFFISNNPCDRSQYKGGIYFLDLTRNNSQAQPFKLDHPLDFYPHGLSFLQAGHTQYLFTNNHRQDGTHTVEIFKISSPGELQHLETIKSSLLTSPNDLVALGSRQFYVTNDGRSHDRAVRSLDTYLGRKTGNVLFFDGSELKIVVDNLYFPNGIAFDKYRKQLVVGETLSGDLLFYQPDKKNKLTNVDKFHIGVGIDNISFNVDNSALVVAVHPNLLALSNHMEYMAEPSPSQVFIYSYQTKGLKLFYQNNGSTISGVSAAVMHGQDIYLGAVCDNKLIKLTMDGQF